MSKKTVKQYDIEAEREGINQSVLTYQLGKATNNEYSKLGKTLADRNVDNSSIWDIIVEKSNNKTYGTGWNYIEKGTTIEGYGKSKYR